MFWRRAIDPNFDAKTLMPAIIETVGMLLNPVRAETKRAQPAAVPKPARKSEAAHEKHKEYRDLVLALAALAGAAYWSGAATSP